MVRTNFTVWIKFKFNKTFKIGFSVDIQTERTVSNLQFDIEQLNYVVLHGGHMNVHIQTALTDHAQEMQLVDHVKAYAAHVLEAQSLTAQALAAYSCAANAWAENVWASSAQAAHLQAIPAIHPEYSFVSSLVCAQLFHVECL